MTLQRGISRSILLFVTSVLAVLSLSQPLYAIDALLVTVENTTGVAAADLHVAFSGAGGNVRVDPFSIFAPGCPTPLVPSNPPAVEDTVVIDWGSACVEPGQTVVFVVRTNNGPLAVTGAFWTNTVGGNIGGAVAGITPMPPAGGNPFSPIKFWSWYIGGSKTYTRFKVNHDQFMRVCCRQPRWCFTNVYYCPNANRYRQFFEIDPWYLLATTHAYTKARYTYFIDWVWGITPPRLPMPQGPRPRGYGVFDAADLGLDARYSSNGGQTFRKGSDFTSTFFTFAESLATHPTFLPPVPPVYTTTQSFIRLGMRYNAAALTLPPLIQELDSVRVFEPSPLLDNIRSDLVNLQAATLNVAAQLLSGVVVNPAPFTNFGNALTALGNNITLVDPSPRFDNAASTLFDAANFANLAAAQVGAGLPDTVSVARFGYDMRERVPASLRGFGEMMWPHFIIQVNIPNYGWYPSTIDGAHVIIRDEFNVVINDIPLAVSDRDEIVVPAMEIPDGKRLKVTFKLPTFLSVSTDFYYSDGGRVGPFTLIGGDANNDDCVSLVDLAQVAAEFGQGGWGAIDSPPPSDVNGDGIVNGGDNAVVGGNLGKCGPILAAAPTITPRFTAMAAFPNPSSGTTMVRFTLPQAARVSIRVYDVSGREVAVAADRQFGAGENEVVVAGKSLASGVYFCRLRATGLVGGPLENVTRFTILK